MHSSSSFHAYSIYGDGALPCKLATDSLTAPPHAPAALPPSSPHPGSSASRMCCPAPPWLVSRKLLPSFTHCRRGRNASEPFQSDLSQIEDLLIVGKDHDPSNELVGIEAGRSERSCQNGCHYGQLTGSRCSYTITTHLIIFTLALLWARWGGAGRGREPPRHGRLRLPLLRRRGPGCEGGVQAAAQAGQVRKDLYRS
jgi:hypothetical protein